MDVEISSKLNLDHNGNALYKLENVGLCMEVIERYKIATTGLATRDFVEKKEKFVLTFVWELMRKVEHLDRINQNATRIPEKLLKWVRLQVSRDGKPSARKRGTIKGHSELQVKNMSSFSDGKVLSALFRSRHPLAQDPSLSREEMIGVALEAISNEYGVPRLLEAEELAEEETDAPSMTAYLHLVKAAFENEAYADRGFLDVVIEDDAANNDEVDDEVAEDMRREEDEDDVEHSVSGVVALKGDDLEAVGLTGISEVGTLDSQSLSSRVDWPLDAHLEMKSVKSYIAEEKT